jgi:hypothetical protein
MPNLQSLLVAFVVPREAGAKDSLQKPLTVVQFFRPQKYRPAYPNKLMSTEETTPTEVVVEEATKPANLSLEVTISKVTHN